MTTFTIKAKNPVREAFADRSTGSGKGAYYRTKGHAVNAFDGALMEYDLCLDPDDCFDFSGDTGRRTIDVHDEFRGVVGRAVFTWHRMENSGHYEFIGYLA